MKKFKKGDQVREIGKQQVMIVEEDAGLAAVATRSGLSRRVSSSGMVVCSWRDNNGKHIQRSFADDGLELVSQASTPRFSGLSAFAAPGVLEARMQCEKDAANIIKQEFPLDQHVDLVVNRLFEELQYQHQRIDVPLIVDCYRTLRAKA